MATAFHQASKSLKKLKSVKMPSPNDMFKKKKWFIWQNFRFDLTSNSVMNYETKN